MNIEDQIKSLRARNENTAYIAACFAGCDPQTQFDVAYHFIAWKGLLQEFFDFLVEADRVGLAEAVR